MRYGQQMDRYLQLQALVETLDRGSFTDAASRLGVAKSAVSRRVRDLEDRLGTPLLLRTTRSVAATPEGAALAERARVLLADWDEAEGEVRASHGALHGPVRASLPLSYGLNRLSPALTAFARLHPQVALDLDLSDRKVDVVGEGFDIAVRLGELADSSLRARRLETSRIQAAASPAFLDAYGTPTTVEELRRLPELHFALRPRTGWTVVDPEGREHHVELPGTHRATNGDILLDMAKAGLGLAVEPDFILAPALASGELVEVLPDHAFPTITAHVLMPPTRRLSRRVRALVDHLAEWCGSETTNQSYHSK